MLQRLIEVMNPRSPQEGISSSMRTKELQRLIPIPELEAASILVSVAATSGGELEWADLFVEAALHGTAAQTGTGLEYFEDVPVRKAWNRQDGFDQVRWSMSRTYSKKNDSRKVSNETCKPKRTILDKNGIDTLTQTLSPVFPGLGNVPRIDFQQEVVSRRLVVVER
jgi:hypothetical protein